MTRRHEYLTSWGSKKHFNFFHLPFPSSFHPSLRSFGGQATPTVPAIAKGDGWVEDPVFYKIVRYFYTNHGCNETYTIATVVRNTGNLIHLKSNNLYAMLQSVMVTMIGYPAVMIG